MGYSQSLILLLSFQTGEKIRMVNFHDRPMMLCSWEVTTSPSSCWLCITNSVMLFIMKTVQILLEPVGSKIAKEGDEHPTYAVEEYGSFAFTQLVYLLCRL